MTPNPIAAGIPADARSDPDRHQHLDHHRRHVRRRRAPSGGRSRASGCSTATDDATDDPNVLKDGGSILPIGGLDHGHKGFALALLVEALTQGLGGYGRAEQPSEWGAAVLVLAFAPAPFGGAEAFLRQTDWLAEACRDARPAARGAPPVRLPGQPRRWHARARRTDGLRARTAIVQELAGAGRRPRSIAVPIDHAGAQCSETPSSKAAQNDPRQATRPTNPRHRRYAEDPDRRLSSTARSVPAASGAVSRPSTRRPARCSARSRIATPPTSTRRSRRRGAPSRTASGRGRRRRSARRCCSALADLVRAHKEELAVLESLDSGKTIRDCLHEIGNEVPTFFQWYAELIDKTFGKVAPTADNVVALIVKEPIGVAGLVLPWNFPLLMAAWKVAPALAAGCSAVLKPAEQTPLTALRLAELAIEAGVPPGVLNVVPGSRRDGRPGDRPPPGHRRRVLHRLDRGRRLFPEIFRREQSEAGRPRDGRQEPVHRARRRGDQRRPRRPRRHRRPSGTAARTAPPTCARSSTAR